MHGWKYVRVRIVNAPICFANAGRGANFTHGMGHSDDPYCPVGGFIDKCCEYYYFVTKYIMYMFILDN